MANLRDLKKEWMEENKNDKIKVNYVYSVYLDALCKSGVITQKQWQNADTRIIK